VEVATAGSQYIVANNYFNIIDNNYMIKVRVIGGIVYGNIFDGGSGNNTAIQLESDGTENNNNVISNNVIMNCYYGGIFSSSSNADVISNNNIYNCATSDGININHSVRTRVTGNDINGCENGIVLQNNCYDCIVSNNSIYDVLVDGIELYGQITRCVISNNTIRNVSQQTNNTGDSIWIDNSTYNIITGNNIREDDTNKARYAIIEDTAGCDYNLISNNIITGTVTGNIVTIGVNSLVGDNIV
jgi:parallel beta-helix repeat protein